MSFTVTSKKAANIEFIYHSVIHCHLKGSCKYSIYISQCHSLSPQRKLQIFNLYITVSFIVTSKEAANIQFIYHSVIHCHLKGSCKYSIYISQCHSLSPQRKLQIFNLYITVSFIVTSKKAANIQFIYHSVIHHHLNISKEAANIQFIYHSVIHCHLKESCKYSIYISQCHLPSPRRKLQIHVFNLYFTYIYISETIHKHKYKNYIHLYMYLSF